MLFLVKFISIYKCNVTNHNKYPIFFTFFFLLVDEDRLEKDWLNLTWAEQMSTNCSKSRTKVIPDGAMVLPWSRGRRRQEKVPYCPKREVQLQVPLRLKLLEVRTEGRHVTESALFMRRRLKQEEWRWEVHCRSMSQKKEKWGKKLACPMFLWLCSDVALKRI